MTDPVEAPDPDIDDIPWQELGEFDELYEAVHTALGEHREFMRHSTQAHGVGTFLNVLVNLGYRVTKIEVPPFPATEETT
jgi:hypothetical protein